MFLLRMSVRTALTNEFVKLKFQVKADRNQAILPRTLSNCIYINFQ